MNKISKALALTGILFSLGQKLPAVSQNDVDLIINQIQTTGKEHSIYAPKKDVSKESFSQSFSNVNLDDEFYDLVNVSYLNSSDGYNRAGVALVRLDQKGAFVQVIMDGKFEKASWARLDGYPDYVIKTYVPISEMQKMISLAEEKNFSLVDILAERYTSKCSCADPQSVMFYDLSMNLIQ